MVFRITVPVEIMAGAKEQDIAGVAFVVSTVEGIVNHLATAIIVAGALAAGPGRPVDALVSMGLSELAGRS